MLTHERMRNDRFPHLADFRFGGEQAQDDGRRDLTS